MSRKRIIYWGITGAILAAGLVMSVVERDGRYAFEWRGAELMAQPKVDEYHDIASLQVFNRVLLQLQQNYVDASRLEPSVMIAMTLDSLQKSIPELLLVFDRKVKEKPTQVTVNIAGQSRTFALDNLNNLWEMSLRLRSILAFIQEYLPKDANPRELEYDAINGMLSALDPHSLILSPEVYRSMMEGNRGKFGGLGIVVRMIDGVLIVVEPIEGDVPAKKAGLQEGDQILTIDGTPTLNMNVSEAVDLLKGEPDTTVRLTVMRKGWKEAKTIDVVRAEISIPSLEADKLGDNLVYIKLKSFQGNSQSEMLRTLDKMKSEMGKIEGLVLDLRGNPGGLLDQAVMIADNFLDEGTIVTTVGANDLLQKPRNAKHETTQETYPIAILMDSSSASASEIVAGALKNNDRAIIIGDTSFGKGSVQVLYELPDKSALKLTIGQYLTPGNRSIQSVGIVPDIRLVPQRAIQDDIDLYPKPWERREESLGGHLNHESAYKDQKPAYQLRYLSKRYEGNIEDELDEDSILTLEDIERIIKTKSKTNRPVDDPQVRLARDILKRIGNVYNRKEMVEKFMTGADSLQAEEDTALVEALKGLGIDWTPCESTETPHISAILTSDKPENQVISGDEIILQATATNNGALPVCRVAGRLESSLSRANDKELIFGRIEPGQSVTRQYRIKTNRAQASRVDNVTLGIYLDDGTPIPEKKAAESVVYLETVARPQPAFTIHYAIIDSSPDGSPGNGLLDDHETVTMRIWVSNDGAGTAEKPLVYLKNKTPEIKLLDARAETEALPTGTTTHRDFKFQTTTVGSRDIQLELHVYDKSSTQVLVEKIAFKTSKSDDIKQEKVKKVSGLMTIQAETPLHVSPLSSSNSLTKLPAGTVVMQDATFAGYTHISAGPVLGWMASPQLVPSDNTAMSVLEPKMIATIPRIKLDQMAHVTDQPTIRLKAEVTAFAPLLDYYAYVSSEIDHIYHYEKVAYAPLSHESDHIDTEIPLNPGLNRINLYVRDKNKSEAYETIFVYRK